MKKVILLTAVVAMFAFKNVSAQKKDPAMTGQKLGIGADFAFPTGDFGDERKLAFGGSLQFQTPILTNLNFTLSAGYLNFTGKNISTIPGSVVRLHDYAAFPVKAGANYFLAENFYVGGELGASFARNYGAGTSFVYTPHIGVEFPVSDKGSIDLGARYEVWSNDVKTRFVGLRLAYNFGL